MYEKHALSCNDCDFSAIVTTPDTQEELIKLVNSYRICPECGSHKILCMGFLCSS